VKNVGAPLVEQACNPSHQPLAVRAVDKQNSRVFHVEISIRHFGG
jgi:hypothetical protein